MSKRFVTFHDRKSGYSVSIQVDQVQAVIEIPGTYGSEIHANILFTNGNIQTVSEPHARVVEALNRAGEDVST